MNAPLVTLEILDHGDLTSRDVSGLRGLFDAEYLAEFGGWDPGLPYGYAGHDVHVIARIGGEVVGHVGWARRTIDVDGAAVVIAGVGGVLTSPRMRGSGLGSALMVRAAWAITDAGGIDFGYLGCREEVVPFYIACGWARISAPERSIGRGGTPVEQRPGPPILILPVESTVWPPGPIDLRGRAW